MLFLIWSWEHRAWWAPNHRGYTVNVDEAGRYTVEEAARIVVDHWPPGEEVAVIEGWAKTQGPPPEYSHAG